MGRACGRHTDDANPKFPADLQKPRLRLRSPIFGKRKFCFRVCLHGSSSSSSALVLLAAFTFSVKECLSISCTSLSLSVFALWGCCLAEWDQHQAPGQPPSVGC
ncbi:hypothetical protein CHARACLAT_016439 [Characodon lateralis]|uniref:Uncharacterized protein n=1 Tax=Characodon lateralis TaxID=208331 RepID=A0ABU7CP87_9TELE|nr:hypothetical protein [Characodon lateralis]